MSIGTLTVYALAIVIGAIVVAALLRLVWLALGAYRIHRAGPRPLAATEHSIWRDPGDVAALDLHHGPGGRDGAPVPPYSFIEEHTTGSQPCVSVTDARGRRWRVKWGHEVRSENFAVRLVWACGYYAETTYYVASGTIAGAGRDVAAARADLHRRRLLVPRMRASSSTTRRCTSSSRSTAGRGTTIHSSARRSSTA